MGQPGILRNPKIPLYGMQPGAKEFNAQTQRSTHFLHLLNMSVLLHHPPTTCGHHMSLQLPRPSRSLVRMMALWPTDRSSQRSPASSSSRTSSSSSRRALQPWRTAAAERALGCSLLGLAVTALDVFSPASLHLLQAADAGVHAWVAASVAPQLQALVFGELVSDAALVAGLLGWAWAAAVALGASNERDGSSSSSAGSGVGSSGGGSSAGQALGLAAAAYLAGGPFQHGDPLAVSLLKHSFQRLRPAPELHSTFSFPSGHTTAAVFLVGVLLYLLLPVALGQQRAAAPIGSTSSSDSSGSVQQLAAASTSTISGGGTGAAAGAAAWQVAFLQRRGAAVAGCAGLTAAGRVLSDAHFVSDTLAGACLGTALVAATALAWNWLTGRHGSEAA